MVWECKQLLKTLFYWCSENEVFQDGFLKDDVWQLRQNLISQKMDTCYIISSNQFHKCMGTNCVQGVIRGSRDTEVNKLLSWPLYSLGGEDKAKFKMSDSFMQRMDVTELIQ